MKLENWSITDNDDGYKAPEMIRKYAHGLVYGNPNFPDGHPITTSALKEINLVKGYIKTQNSIYQLGTMLPEYAEYVKGLKK